MTINRINAAFQALVNSDAAAKAMPGIRVACADDAHWKPDATNALLLHDDGYGGTFCKGWTPAPEAEVVVAELNWLSQEAIVTLGINIGGSGALVSLNLNLWLSERDTWPSAIHAAILEAIEAKEAK